jgi:hypothetical protein
MLGHRSNARSLVIYNQWLTNGYREVLYGKMSGLQALIDEKEPLFRSVKKRGESCDNLRDCGPPSRIGVSIA